jgi:hypothetical protein
MAHHYLRYLDPIGYHVAVSKQYLRQQSIKTFISFLDAQKRFLNGNRQEATEEFASACIAYISCCHKYGFDVVGQEIEEINATMNAEELLKQENIKVINIYGINLKITIHAEETNKEMREHIVHILVEFQSEEFYHYCVYAFQTWLDVEKMTQKLEDFKKNTNSLSCVIKRT